MSMTGDDSGGMSADAFARWQAANRRALREVVTPEVLQRIMEVVFAKAMGGDVEAARLWLRYAGRVPARKQRPGG